MGSVTGVQIPTIGARVSVSIDTPRDRETDAACAIQDQVSESSARLSADQAQRADGPLDRLLSQPSVLDRFEDPGTKPPQVR